MTARRARWPAALALLAGLLPAASAEETGRAAPEPTGADPAVLAALQAELDRLAAAQSRIRQLLAQLLGSDWPGPAPARAADGLAVEPGAAAADALGQDFLEDAADLLYRRARTALADRNFYDAERLLREVLADYPQADHIDDVRYWLGEALYQQGQYREAIRQFAQLPGEPESPWWTRAQLRTGYAWYELGEYERARALLAAVRDAAPGSRISQLAQLRLERLEQLRQAP